jgi:hypothetical protein
MKKFLKALEKCPSTHVVKVVKGYAYVQDGIYMYYFDFADFPRNVNISTYENGQCIYFQRCPINQFNWSIEKSRAMLYHTFNIC